MQNTTDVQAGPATDTLPPPPPTAPSSTPATPPNQISQANQAPMLPQVQAAAPSAGAVSTANPFASSLNESYATVAPSTKPQGRSGTRRALSWLIVLAVIGGLAYVGVVYGSDLMELATGEETIDEPSAPLVFPTPATAATSFRTASYVVEQPDALKGPQRYEVTTDFENGISRVLIDRDGAPDLEVLTVFDGAVIRRVDQPTWYQLDRGTFPAGSEFGRARWVRTLDEMLPPALREGATIERATESIIGTDQARRLLVALDPTVVTRLANPQPAADAATPPPPALPAGVTWQPGVDGASGVEVEIWVDSTGLVRKSIMPIELGGETITVTSLSPDPWQPVFPTADMISPLTAAALFDLSL